MPTTSAQELTDHAGAYYPWFASVEVRGTSLHVEGNTGYMGDDSLRASATLTAGDLRKAALKLDNEWHGEDYEGRFYRDFLRRQWDEMDGDQNTVDAILQTAMWGELVFG